MFSSGLASSTVPDREEVNDGRQLIGSAEEEDVDCGAIVRSYLQFSFNCCAEKDTE